MDQTTLVDRDIKAGESVIDALKHEHLKFQAALWMLDDDAATWRLLIASSLVDQDGPLSFYKSVQRALRNHAVAKSFPLSRISAISSRDPLVRDLRQAIAVASHSPGAWIQNSTVNGRHIPAAYIYQLGKSRGHSGHAQ